MYSCAVRTMMCLAVAVAVSQALARQDGPAMRLLADSSNPPFSFTYRGRPSSSLLPRWKPSAESKRIDRARLKRSLRWSDPDTGLQVRCEAIEYRDFRCTEWTVTFKNAGTRDTSIVEDIQALDIRLPGSNAVLRHNVGSPASPSDYAPMEDTLYPGAVKRFAGANGRPTGSTLSYFNLDQGKSGTILAIGWPGQWAAEFRRDEGRGLQVRAGQELTHFRLHPGEEARTPLIVLLDWSGDWIDGQNRWRRWMMAYGMPKPGGRLPRPMMVASSSRAYQEMIGANEANQIMHIDRYLEERLPIAYWWMDAGWYVQQQGWPQVGTWEVDPRRFPRGLRPISDHAHAHGVKTLVWFEPERVAPGTWLADHHPEWLLNPLSPLVVRRSAQLGTNEPCVVFNEAERTLSWNGITWLGRSLSFHPGPKGEYAVVRWTAHAAGDYRVSGSFAGIDAKTTTDVYVLWGREPIFDGLIGLGAGNRKLEFARTVRLDVGGNLDFVVGFGNGAYQYDSTGLSATVAGPDGKVHDAAAEVDSGQWSYGWIEPGTTPNPATFKPFDQRARGGAGGNQLLDLGNPKAWRWLVEHIDRLIVDNGIDLYRQDFNIDPLVFWRSNDAEDRQGMTEIRYIAGYLAYWDELRRRHPNMLIDSCASGGRRNDLETMRRAVPLWRSDYAFEPIGHQGMTYGISMWLPYHGTATVGTVDAPYYGGGATPVQPYAFWSNAAPSFGSGIDIRERSIDYDALRRLFGEWRDMSANYIGDYYPLTPYTLDDAAWIAWQFDRPGEGKGVVQAFRRAKAPSDSLLVKLRGLDSRGSYRLRLIDGPGSENLAGRIWSGAELMRGLPIRLAQSPSAAVIAYEKQAPG